MAGQECHFARDDTEFWTARSFSLLLRWSGWLGDPLNDILNRASKIEFNWPAARSIKDQDGVSAFSVDEVFGFARDLGEGSDGDAAVSFKGDAFSHGVYITRIKYKVNIIRVNIIMLGRR